MDSLVIDSKHSVNIMRVLTAGLSDDEKNNILKKHEAFKNMINNISDIIKECSITDISSIENNYTINFKNKISKDIITFEVENVVKVINIYSGDEDVKVINIYSDDEGGPIGFSIGDLDKDNIYKFNLSYSYSMAVHLSMQYKKDIFGIMFWDIHNKVMPKSRIWAERLIIKGDLNGLQQIYE